jgi:hypothetical protein
MAPSGRRISRKERAVGPLYPIGAAVLFEAVFLPLAGNRDRVLADFNGQIVGGHARHIRTDDELVALLDDIDLRRP